MSFMGALQLILITLKLTDFIDWSWWLVMLPTMVAAVLVLIIALGTTSRPYGRR